jgi:FemAB-related protein (PEP-CTERM system-associated)
MEVLELQEQDKQCWDKYVHGAQQATVFQLAGWKNVMEDIFGLRTFFLYAQEGDVIQGVLPLLLVKSRIAGNYITSMPNAICAQDEAAAQALIQRAKELVRASGADYLVLRDSYQKWNSPDLVTNEDHCTMVVELDDDPEHVWMAFDKRVRQSTKKAIRADVEVLMGRNGLEDLYPAYSRANRDMGTPTLGSAFFSKVLSEFPRHFTVMTVRHEGEVLGGGFVAFFKDTLYNTWGGVLRDSYDLRSNYILYWETLKYGCENGFQWADLGRSEWESGTYQFKRHWTAEPRPLYQQFYLNGSSQLPAVGSTRETDPRYRHFVSVWSRLPLPLTEVLGPWLRRRMPFG